MTDTPYVNDEDGAAQAKRDDARREADEDLRWVMSTAQGRRFMWRLLGDCGVFRASFNPEAATMAYLEGKRGIGLQAMAHIDRACPEQYLRMQEEQVKRDG